MKWITIDEQIPAIQKEVLVFINETAERAWLAQWSNGDLRWVFSNPDLEGQEREIKFWCEIVKPEIGYVSEESKLAAKVEALTAENAELSKSIQQAVEYLYSESDDSGYDALCALGAEP